VHGRSREYVIVTPKEGHPGCFVCLEPLPGVRLSFGTKEEAERVAAQLRPLCPRRQLRVAHPRVVAPRSGQPRGATRGGP